MAILKPIMLNEKVVVSTTHVNPESLERFFQGESVALKREVQRVIPLPESNYSEERLHDIDLTPAFFRRRREQSERLRQREEARKARTEEDELMRFVRLIQKYPSK
jgi:hypothetical protein